MNYLYSGTVYHKRFAPFAHVFTYHSMMVAVDLAAPETWPRLLRFNRFGLWSIYNRDHGARDGGDLTLWLRGVFAEKNIPWPNGRVQLLAMPRYLGYVFNPLSLFLLHDTDGTLTHVVYQVKNTFGGQHCYLVPVDGSAPYTHTADKVFYVSPFFDVVGEYHFKLVPPTSETAIHITYVHQGEKLLYANFIGRGAVLSTWGLLRLFILQPFVTFKVIFAIHIQAVKLRLKGARWVDEPPPPMNDVT